MILKKPPGLKAIVILTLVIAVGAGCAAKLEKIKTLPSALPSTDIGLKITSTYAQILDVLPSRNIGVDIASLPTANQSTPSWNILDKLQEKDDELARVPVSTGPKEIIYYERRVSVLTYGTKNECERRSGAWDEEYEICKSITRKRLSDKERGIGLKLLNTLTGEVEIIKINTKITTTGVEIISPAGYQIETVERPNGIKWNYWNTLYKVVTPENLVVIENLFPREETITSSRVVRGKIKKETKKIVTGFPYVPYNDYLEQEILVKAGADYIKEVVAKAFDTLKVRGVRSKAFSNQLVADITALSPRFFERLPLLEQTDMTEFEINPEKAIKRVLVLIGANKELAFAPTCNRVSACGWIQFTPNTYSSIRKSNPAAQLMPDFKKGAADHTNVMMSAILLHLNNFAELTKKYGNRIETDSRLEEYLAASYNGAPKWVHKSLNATISKPTIEWTKYLKNETLGFMVKLRYLVANDLP